MDSARDLHRRGARRDRAIRRYRSEYGRLADPFTAVVPLTDAFDPGGYRRAEEAGVTMC